MGYYFPIILFLLTVFCTVCYLFYLLIPKKQRITFNEGSYLTFKILCFFKDFFWVLLIVLIIRSIIASLYSVPTGSLEPTVEPGDILLTTKFNYAIKMPVWGKTLISTGTPKRGDIVLFHDPVHPKVALIKRMIGLPGDKISYINKVLYINGHKQDQIFVKNGIDIEGSKSVPAKIYSEHLNGIKHQILINPNVSPENFYNLVVPKNAYFVMGDNRDNSDDSRFWGFVPKQNLFAKANIVAINFKNLKRIGHLL